jgi:hypothetical protein
LIVYIKKKLYNNLKMINNYSVLKYYPDLSLWNVHKMCPNYYIKMLWEEKLKNKCKKLKNY